MNVVSRKSKVHIAIAIEATRAVVRSFTANARFSYFYFGSPSQ